MTFLPLKSNTNFFGKKTAGDFPFGKAPFFLVLLLLLALTVRFCFAQTDSEDAFAAVQEAVENQELTTLEGTKVLAYWWNDGFTLRGVHVLKKRNHVRFEYFSYDDHPYQELISDGEYMYHLNPSKHLAYRSPAGDSSLEEETILALAAKNYVWRGEGQELLANVPTQRIAAQSKADSQIIARYWIDGAHKVILREERYNENGSPIFFSAYMTVSFPKNLPDSLFDVSYTGRIHNLPSPKELEGRKAMSALDFHPLFPRALPQGFRLIGTYLTQWPTTEKLHLRYSDGLRNFSIYENLHRGRYHRLRGSKPAQFNGHFAEYLETPEGKLLRFAEGQLTVAVIGNIPSAMAKEIAFNIGTPVRITPFHRVSHYFRRGLRTLGRLLGLNS